ncbi:MAG: UDP-N-acetylglucosamine 2-epimerase, partial [Victivallaceae bacterium]
MTKFAQLHFPSTQRSAEYIIRMGERPDSVFNYGCPAGDYIRELDTNLPADIMSKFGVGSALDINSPFLLVIYHPVTTQFGTERAKVSQLIEALHELQHPTIWIWPNIDAGADDISKALRVYREHNANKWLHLIKNLDPTSFQKCLKKTACA